MIRAHVCLAAALLVTAAQAQESDVPSLISRLGSEDPEERKVALETLARMAEADPAILDPHANHPDVEIRECVRGILRDLPRRRVARRSLKSLGNIRPVGAPSLSLAWSADGRFLASGGEGPRTICLWDMQNRSVAGVLELPADFDGDLMAQELAWSGDGKHVWAGGLGLACWEVESGRMERFLKLYSVSRLTLSSDGKRFACREGDTVLTLDLERGDDAPRVCSLPASGEAFLRFEDSDRVIRVGIGTRGHVLLDAATGERIGSKDEEIRSDLAEKSRVFVLAGERRLFVHEQNEIPIHPEIGFALISDLVAVSADGTRIAAIDFRGEGEEVVVFDATGKQLQRMELPSAATGMAWSPDGRALAVSFILATTPCDHEGRIVVFRDGKSLILNGHSTRPRHVSLSADGDFVAYHTEFWGDDWVERIDAHVVHLATGIEFIRADAQASARDASSFHVVTRTGLGVLDARTGTLRQVAEAPEPNFSGRALVEPEGLAWVGDYGGGGLYETRDGRLRRVNGVEVGHHDAEWSLHERWLATLTRGDDLRCSILILDVKSRKTVFQDKVDSEAIAWAPDGSYLLMSHEGFVRRLVPDSLQELPRIRTDVRVWRFIDEQAAVSAWRTRLTLWHWPTMSIATSWDFDRRIEDVQVSSDGSRLAVVFGSVVQVFEFGRE